MMIPFGMLWRMLGTACCLCRASHIKKGGVFAKVASHCLPTFSESALGPCPAIPNLNIFLRPYAEADLSIPLRSLHSRILYERIVFLL